MRIIEIFGDSMSPKIKDGSLLLAKRINLNKLNRGDLVTYLHNNKLMVKRIVGLPDETVELKMDYIYINGKKTKLNYPNCNKTHNYVWQTSKNEIVILGDNLDDSLDSKKLGSISMTFIQDKIIFQIWPPRKI